MKPKRSLAILVGIMLGYVGILIWMDATGGTVSALPRLLSVLPTVAALAMTSFLIRYLRWHWLLTRAGKGMGLARGLLPYFTGFAFTATPGKVGELVRIRYFVPHGVSPSRILATFVYERAADLVVVLALAALLVESGGVFAVAVGFVALFLGVLFVLALNARGMARMAAYARKHRQNRLARLLATVRGGISGCRIWMNPTDVAVVLLLGGLAWGITSYGFVLLVEQLGVLLPWSTAFAIYPLAMLAGAASMLPGGVGSTEVAIVALLVLHGASVGLATLAAIGIRVSTMWFAVVCGLVAIAILETRSGR